MVRTVTPTGCMKVSSNNLSLDLVMFKGGLPLATAGLNLCN